jgi:hypothetical protein
VVSSWEAGRRLDYIDFRLAEGLPVRRADLMRTFGVSPSQASSVISQFLRLHPGAMAYDASAKEYRAAAAGGYVTRRGMTGAVRVLVAALAELGHPLGWR